MEPYTNAELTSKDGTRIGYLTAGSGPALVLLHGGMSTSAQHRELGAALAERFTVVIPDRRDRGMTDPRRTSYDVARDVEDVAALLERFGAERLWGLSSGGVIALEAALRLPRINRLAVYEPAIFGEANSVRLAGQALVRDLDAGNLPGAMVTAMLKTEMGPRFSRLIPRLLLESMSRGALHDPGGGQHGYARVRDLIPPLRHDFELALHATEAAVSFSGIRAKTLLMGGSTSQAYLKRGLRRLEAIIPGAVRIELVGLAHASPWNADRGGQPATVAAALRAFFA